MKKQLTLAVVGNPNSGKTSLFNAMTGARQRVGNWPGVTVERKTGHFSHRGCDFRLVDLPGTYSLDVADEEISLDERIARDYIATGEADVIVNVIDVLNLERNLYLSAQLLELGRPMLLVLNKMDAARSRGIEVDTGALQHFFGCPVIAVSSTDGEGIGALKDALCEAARTLACPRAVLHHAPEVEEAVRALRPDAEKAVAARGPSWRWLALRLLDGDGLARRIAGAEAASRADDLARQVEQATGEDMDIILADARYGFAHEAAGAVLHHRGEVPRQLSERIDRFVLNRFLGLPVFFLIMYLMFMLSINLGGAFIDFFDILGAALFVDGTGALLSHLGVPAWLTVIFANGLGGGLQVVATFIPVIGFLFLCLSVIEDSGYMARAAFVMDRLMRAIGLPGKAFVPMLIGFGCNVPAIMATRTMEFERDRLLSIMMNPFISCGARLPVYALFAAAFFPHSGQNLVFALYMIGIGAAVLTGLLMKKTLFGGQVSPFIMELPAYQIPAPASVLLRSWDRLKAFLSKAGRVIVPMVLLLNVLNAVTIDGRPAGAGSGHSLLADAGRAVTPVFAPIGIKEDNWPATVGIFSGIMAKEAVVGTLDTLYSGLARDGQDSSAPLQYSFDLSDALMSALATVPANLAAVADGWSDPFNLNSAGATASATAAGTFGSMQARFDGKVGAFAYLLFILLYMPCISAVAAIYREAGRRWTLFVVGWTTILAYAVSSGFYQAATFARHPVFSAVWLLILVLVFLGIAGGLRIRGRQLLHLPPAVENAP